MYLVLSDHNADLQNKYDNNNEAFHIEIVDIANVIRNTGRTYYYLEKKQFPDYA